MDSLKDIFLKALKAIKREYTRVDLTCNNCGREIFGGESVGEKLFCPDCYANLPFNSGLVCAKCGRSVPEQTSLCDDCVGYEWSYDVARSPFYYSTPISQLIRQLKYNNKRYLATVFGKFLAEYFVKYFAGTEIITYMPMTRKAERRRRFNQGELLAKSLSQEVGVPYSALLEKTVATERQARLGRTDRLNNLKGTVRAIKGVDLTGKIVLFVDDVMTTGATAEIACAALKKAGAEWIFVLTVASVTNKRTAKLLGQKGEKNKRRRYRRADFADNSDKQEN